MTAGAHTLPSSAEVLFHPRRQFGHGIAGVAPSTGQAGRAAHRNVQDLRSVAAVRGVGVVRAADRKDRRVREIVGTDGSSGARSAAPVDVATIAATAGTVTSGPSSDPQTRTWPQKNSPIELGADALKPLGQQGDLGLRPARRPTEVITTVVCTPPHPGLHRHQAPLLHGWQFLDLPGKVPGPYHPIGALLRLTRHRLRGWLAENTQGGAHDRRVAEG